MMDYTVWDVMSGPESSANMSCQQTEAEPGGRRHGWLPWFWPGQLREYWQWKHPVWRQNWSSALVWKLSDHRVLDRQLPKLWISSCESLQSPLCSVFVSCLTDNQTWAAYQFRQMTNHVHNCMWHAEREKLVLPLLCFDLQHVEGSRCQSWFIVNGQKDRTWSEKTM